LEPYGFPAGALRIRTKRFERGVIDGSIVVAAGEGTSAGAEVLAEEHGIFVKRVFVAGKAGNPFREKRREEIRARKSKHLLVEAKDVEVIGVLGDLFANAERRYSRQIGEPLVKITGILPALGILGFEPLQLFEEDRSLKLRQAVVPTQPVIFVPGPAGFASAPDVGIAEFGQVSIVCGYQPSFPGGHVLRRLKAECSCISYRP